MRITDGNANLGGIMRPGFASSPKMRLLLQLIAIRRVGALIQEKVTGTARCARASDLMTDFGFDG